jgi:hypothetical protein
MMKEFYPTTGRDQMKKVLLAALMSLFVLFLLPLPSIAQHGHMAAEKQPMMKMASTDIVADGLVVTFMVMPNSTHKNMLKNMKMEDDIELGSTHNIMVLIRDEKTGEEFTGARVSLKVVDSDDDEQIKTGSYKKMMRTFDAYFKLANAGKYMITILLDTGVQKRSIGISYDMNS